MEALRYLKSTFKLETMPDLTGKVAIVTGGNTGIGYETVKWLAKNNCTVYMASRSKERAEEAIQKLKQDIGKDILFLQLDLQSFESVKKAANVILDKKIAVDLLINNAGIMACPFALTVDERETQFGTNHLGHFYFTTLLIPAILKAKKPRIVNLSSAANELAPKKGIDFENINNEKAYSTTDRYGQSKLANILFSRGLHKRYGDKIIINSVHPGGVNTELKRGVIESFPIFNYLGWIVDPILYLIFLTPEQGALASLYAATSPEIEEKDYRNRYIVPYGAVSDRVNPLALDDKLAEELWDFSTKAVEKFKSNKK